MARPPDPDAVFQQVATAAKYRTLDERFVRRVTDEAAARMRDQSEAVKYAKRKLHQAFGAFVSQSPGQAVRACLAAIADGTPVRDACTAGMRAHASTAERIPHLSAFAAQVLDWCGRPSRVVDLACGLNPLALPWLALGPDPTYWCTDIDTDLITALPDLSTAFGVTVQAQARDLLAPGPLPAAELVLLLKTLTTLEQQRTGAGRDVLMKIDSPYVVASLPLSSLAAGRRYATDAAAVVHAACTDTPYTVAEHAAFGDELVCLLTREVPR